MTKRGGVVLFSLAGLIAVGYVGAAFLPSGQKAPADAPSAERLWLDNQARDDERRSITFQSEIRGRGERCDKVLSALMGAPGNWVVACAPGYRYTFTFDASAKLVSLDRR